MSGSIVTSGGNVQCYGERVQFCRCDWRGACWIVFPWSYLRCSVRDLLCKMYFVAKVCFDFPTAVFALWAEAFFFSCTGVSGFV